MRSNVTKYEAFFGRSADETLAPRGENASSCYVHRFLPRRVNFFKRLFTPLNDVCVYITDGMSTNDMSLPPELQGTYPSRVDLIACTEAPIVGGKDSQDIVTRILQWLAEQVAQRQTFVGPMHSIDLGEIMCPGSEMTGFFFGVPDGVEMRRLCGCTAAAQLVVSVIPVTTTELQLVTTKGPEALMDAFERAGIRNLFDPFRKGIAEQDVPPNA